MCIRDRTYTLNNGVDGTASPVQSLHDGESVTDTFQVTATDTFGGVSTTETLTITITGTNDIPVITGGLTGSTTEDNVVDFTGQLTGDDIDNTDSVDAWNVVGPTAGAYGDLALNPDGSWTYTPVSYTHLTLPTTPYV